MDKANVDESWFWHPTLRVGMGTIDDDHKQLFRLFNEIRLAEQSAKVSNSLLNEMAKELVFFIESHFKREESIMESFHYVGFKEHRETHQEMMVHVQAVLDKTISGDGSIADFVLLLKNLFLAHTDVIDHQLAEYIDNHSRNHKDLKAMEFAALSLPNQINIYIVDDEEQQVALMLELVEIAGFTGLGFTSARSFLEQSISNHDIVLLDLNMPEVDGIEVMRILYNRDCTPAFILMSGFDDRVLHSAKQFAEAKDLEVLSTYTKPVDVAEFIKDIAEVHAIKKLAFDRRQSQGLAQESDVNTGFFLEDLEIAIEQHQFMLFYQPQLGIKSGKLKGFEALVRLDHPSKGLIYPNQFISLAEDNGLIVQVTTEIFNLAIKDYKSLQQQNFKIPPSLSINISAQDLDLGMPERLAGLVASSDIPPGAIMIELTESAFQSSVSDSLDILNRLRMKGFLLSIDDFGTGYSSLVQLYQAPFTELKIDLKFVINMLEDKEAYAIVKICILLAKELNLKTVAEGVETKEVFEELKRLGCDIAQGYYIAKPLAFEDCCEWLKRLPDY